ncbi:MAG TPA: divergent polysaccharide deacetylase family protein [Gammaproteobacteria bacterium]|nr:divergent polysaccharide deacetylase family protein [Gammaproteobacteria bacterium]
MNPDRTGRSWPVFVFLLLLVATAQARTPLPAVSIVIDDMGKRLEPGERVLALPSGVACAFLPAARYTETLAERAHADGREVMLHLPMQSVDGRRLDRGAVTLDMTERQFDDTVRADLARVPYASGINNHMGSLLTRHPGHMAWLMKFMRTRGNLFFVDSRTTAATVAYQLARENGIPATERRVFLDNQQDEGDIAFQFRRLLRLARKEGSALAIGHPHPATLSFLERALPRLGREGVRLVPVRTLIELQQEDRKTWQAYWSPSPRAARNSKPSL